MQSGKNSMGSHKHYKAGYPKHNGNIQQLARELNAESDEQARQLNNRSDEQFGSVAELMAKGSKKKKQKKPKKK